MASGHTVATAVPRVAAPSVLTSYHTVLVDGLHLFYREAGPATAPTIVLLHGGPSSSHEFRDLIPLLADRYHMTAPDYPGFGYSDAPAPARFAYTFNHLADVIDDLLGALKLTRYSLYMHDFGGPVGFRLATRHPRRVQALIVQNANAYLEGNSPALDSFKPFWAHRDAATEKAARAILTPQVSIFEYTHGAAHPESISPDAWTSDQYFLEQPGRVAIQLDLLYDLPANFALYPAWQSYLRRYQPPTLIVWGRNDSFFTVAGARAYLRDLPQAELHLLNIGRVLPWGSVTEAAAMCSVDGAWRSLAGSWAVTPRSRVARDEGRSLPRRVGRSTRPGVSP